MREFKVISSKIPNTLFVRLQAYCKKEGLTLSTFVKDLIESEISTVVPHNKSGRNVISYDKKQDTFTWNLEYDDGENTEVARNVTPAFVEDALKALTSEMRARELYLKKEKDDSVPAPTKIKKVVK